MTFDVNEFQVGQPITFNFDELKTELTEKVQHYKTLVYTDDQVADAKKDKANLNKLREAIETRRKEIKKQCLAPYEEFETKVKEIVAILDEPIGLIDKQVKDFDSKKKDEKREQIEAEWENIDKPEWLKLEQIWDDKWLNVSTSMKSIKDSWDNTITRIINEVAIIASLPHPDEAYIIYQSTLSLAQATSESARIAEIQKAVDTKKALEEIPEPTPISDNEELVTVRFECSISQDQAKKLAKFCKDNGIVLKKI